MRDLNRCEFIGRLGGDPDVRYTQSGKTVANISIAVNRHKKDDPPEWVPIVFWDKLAEIAGKYLKKGAQIYVSGRWQVRKWQDQQGQDRYTTEIVAEDMQMLGERQQQREQAPRQSAPPADDFGDEVPF